MFSVGFIIGIYGYLIYFLGLIGQLNGPVIFSLTILYGVFLFVIRRLYLGKLNPQEVLSFRQLSLIEKLCLLILALIFLINLIGVIAPELAFDALWYHLTLPKLYKEYHSVLFIPGGLLYYSAMPKLTEMLYTAALFTPIVSLPKLIHFSFGILTTITIFIIAKEKLGRKFGFLAAVIFYSNIVVAWESTNTYVDLARMFFEVLAFWGMLLWIKTQKTHWLIESALMLGLAISTKLLAIVSLPLLLLLILLKSKGESTKIAGKRVVLYILLTLLVPLPWFVFAFVHTGNPIYPFLSSSYPLTYPNVFNFFGDIFHVMIRSDDPISPLYLIVLPLSILFYRKLPAIGKYILLYSLGALVVWFLTPRTGGGRFLLPYLPVLSLLVVYMVATLQKERILYKTSLILIFFIALLTIGYRGVASLKYAPVVFGTQSRDDFLTKNLNYSFGDFYDTDGFFQKTINQEDRVLLYGFHNLFYVNFPFIHESWVRKGDSFNYIAVQNSNLPKRFTGWPLIYENKTTHVKVYSIGKGIWIY